MILYKAEFEEFRAKEAEYLNIPSKDTLEYLQRKLEKLSGFAPVCELIPIYEIYEISNSNTVPTKYKYILISTDVILRYNDYSLSVYTDTLSLETEKSYKLNLYNEIQHDYLKNSKPANEGLTEPQRIETATPQKMDAWLQYLINVEYNKIKIISEKQQKIQKYLEQFTAYDEEIKWGKNKQNGSMERGGLYFNFCIKQSGEIIQSINLCHNSNRLLFTDFLLISDNALYRQNHDYLDKTNAEIIELASGLAEKEMSDRFHMLSEQFYNGENYKEEYQDVFNALYDKYHSFICRITNFEYPPNQTKEA